MNRKVLIEVRRERNSDYATLLIRMADKDRTPLLNLRVTAGELAGNLGPEWDGTLRTLTDGEIVTR